MGFNSLKLNDANIVIAGGSDCPIEEGNPIYEYSAAVTSTNHEGYPEGGWQPQEMLSRIEGLQILTQGAAYSEFSENTRGTIEVGNEADLTILSDDMTTVPQDKILQTKIIATIVDGKIVYGENNL